jgi:hypothetical protein
MKRSILTLFGVLICIGHASSTWAVTSPAPTPPKTTCIDSDTDFKKILDHFSWRSNDPQFKPDFCDPQNLAYRVAESVLNLAVFDVWYSQSAHSKDDHGVLASGPFHYFSSRIRKFVFEPDGRNCNGSYAAYVDEVGDGIMHICKRLAAEEDLYLTSVLVHEARHQDGERYNHVRCNHGRFGGSSLACDESYASRGAYGVQTEYYIQISHMDQVAPSTRQFARADAIKLLVERFNTLPMGIKNGAVLVSKDSNILFYDGETATSLHALPQPELRVMKQGGLLSFYDSAKNSLTPLADGLNLDSAASIQSQELNGSIDIYENEPYLCSLFSNRVTCITPKGKVTLPIKDFTPIGFWNYDLQDPSDIESGSGPTLYIASKEKRVYAFSLGSKKVESKPTYARNLGVWNQDYFITLGFDGKVRFAKTHPSSNDFFVAPQGLNPDARFTRMITPYFWSKELQEL